MKTGIIRPSSSFESGRLDAKYYLSPGTRAMTRLKSARKLGLRLDRLGGERGLARCWNPDRFKRAYAVEGEEAVPYLRPYDVFNYVPLAADWLSKSRTKKLATYILRPDMLLQTASGRNLGPAVSSDTYISRFVLGDDMIRLEIGDENTRYFVLAFLQSPTGQVLMQRDKTGSVIDHMSPEQLGDQLVPRFEDAVERRISDSMREAVRTREKARESIREEFSSYEAKLPSIRRTTQRKFGWTVMARNLTGRLDAAPYEPLLGTIRKELASMGGKALGLAAEVSKPAGRYKTRYVEKEYGLPLLSGTQALQATPIKLQFIAKGAISEVEKYYLNRDMTVIQADGRAEEGLGFPAMITPDRDGWLASGHVGRISPKGDTEPGWLYMSIRSFHVQTQLRALACGSVVDALYEADIESVVLAPSLDANSKRVRQAWELFAKAQEAEDRAIEDFEACLDRTLSSK